VKPANREEWSKCYEIFAVKEKINNALSALRRRGQDKRNTRPCDHDNGYGDIFSSVVDRNSAEEP